LIRLSGQTSDSSICYDKPILQKIALRLIEANECDTLLSICEQTSVVKDSLIAGQTRIINNQDSQIKLEEEINVRYTQQILALENDLKKANRKIKWIKLGWASTSVALGGALIYFIIN
jgi:hypothetical protein